MDYKWASGICLTLGTPTRNDALAFCNTQGIIILGRPKKQASFSKFNHALLINGSSYELFILFWITEYKRLILGVLLITKDCWECVDKRSK